MVGHENNYEAYYSSGVSRDTRTPAILLPENVPIDERNLEDDLVFAGTLSNYINFYNSQNELAGTWHPFFGKSEPVLLATIATTNLEAIDREFNHHLMLFDITKRKQKQLEELQHLFNSTLGIALRIDHWHKHLLRDSNNSVLREIESQIEGRLRVSWLSLKYIDENSAKPEMLGYSFKGDYSIFSDKWKLKDLNKLPNVNLDTTNMDVSLVVLRALRSIYNDFFHALIHIVKYTRKNLETILEEKHDNRPDISLYIAFSRLMKKLRLQMNTITERHIDFYYFDVLRHVRLSFNPDHALVRFELQESVRVLQLPKGTELVAGKDEVGKELIYTTDKDIFINHARITALRTLFVSRNPQVKTGVMDKTVRMVKGIYSSNDPSLMTNGTPQEWWPLMGCDQLSMPSNQTSMKEAELGFSITSSALFLSEGQREVMVTFSLDKNEASLKKLRKIISEVMYHQSRNQSGAIFQLFSKALSVSITSAEGWQTVSRYAFTYDDEKADLILRFNFTTADPAVVAYDPALHGDGFDSQWPVLRMMLNTTDAPVYAYSLLSDVLVNRIRIRTDVKGVRKLSLYNSAGRLSAEKPFQPFGALPLPGSYLLIGCSEAMNKNIESMQIHFSWNDLPSEGFTEYYKGYPGEITNASFTAGISLLQEGYFLPLRDDQQALQLFYDAPTDHPERGIPIQPESTLDAINVALLRQRPSWAIPKQQLTFAPETQDGFLKLELLTPSIGFGSAEYAPLLSSTILKNSRTKHPQPLPKLPYTPVVSNISLDYSAEFDSENAAVEDGELPIGIYRHNPFGLERVSVASSFRNVKLFPTLDNEGYLFIGLTGLELPQAISILFKLSDESLYSHEAPDAVEWSYLCGNTWKTFRDDRVLADGTKRFVQPGIVELDLPGEMTNDSTIMPSGMYWICASVKDKTHCISYARTLFTQAVSVTWKDMGNTFTHLDLPLPAGSITKPKQKIPEIKAIIQPIASTGGSMPEEKREAYARLSERLSHRDRALLPIDYERLVMQQFPTVYKAQCFPDMDGEEKHKRGNVLVVVIPDIDRRKDINVSRPKDSYSRLQEIKEFLQERSGPFTKVEVRNPLYERVKVIAKIKFKKGVDSGFYLRQLNDDMRAYLSPWLYDQQVEVRLGGLISRSDVLGFVESQPYVEFVTALSVVVTKDHNGFYSLEDTARMMKDKHRTEDIGTIHAGKPWSILVTASRHLFTAIDEEVMTPPEPRGIDNLMIGDDFIITQ